MQGSKQQSTGGFTTQCFITGMSVGGEGGVKRAVEVT